MTTLEPIESLSARVAELMGWELVHYPSRLPNWRDASKQWRDAPHHPAEVFRLMCEFRVFPAYNAICECVQVHIPGGGMLVVKCRDTTEAIERAMSFLVLLAVEQILKEKKA